MTGRAGTLAPSVALALALAGCQTLASLQAEDAAPADPAATSAPADAAPAPAQSAAPGAPGTLTEEAAEAPALTLAALDPASGLEGEALAALPDSDEAAALIEEATRGPIDTRLMPVPQRFVAWADTAWRDTATLPGIWIAHPAATASARVRLIDAASGRAADGALVPYVGAPNAILSKAAGEALGLRPFGDQRLLVVAIELPPALPVVPDLEPAPVIAAQAGPQTGPQRGPETAIAADPDAAEAPVGTAALDTPTETLLAPPPDAATAPAEGAPEPAQTDDTPVALAAAPAAGRTPEPQPQAEAPVAEEPADLDGEGFRWADGTPAADTPAPAPDPVPDPVPEPAVLARAAPAADATRPTATAPESQPEPEPAPQAAIEAAPETASEPAPEPAAAEAPLKRRFVQAGLFAVPLNATKLVRDVQNAGFPAQTEPAWIGERVVARVIVGPFDSRAQRQEALALLGRLGAPDALPIAR